MPKEKEVYDYSKLLGRIKELGYTTENFADTIGMNPSTFSCKINNKSDFKQREMVKSLKVLKEPISKVKLYFFCRSTLENQSIQGG